VEYITKQDVVEWLRSLERDAIVYRKGSPSQSCTLNVYAETVLGIEGPTVGYSLVQAEDGRIVASIEATLEDAIIKWDKAVKENWATYTLTAKEALELMGYTWKEDTVNNVTIGDWLTEQRQRAGVTRTEVAKTLRYPGGAVKALEENRRVPQANTVVDYLFALDGFRRLNEGDMYSRFNG
jgi:hypothetical protein